MARVVTHFGRINNQHRRQERKMISNCLVLDTEEHPWWIVKYAVTFRGIIEVESRLKSLCERGQLVFENKVRRGKRGDHVRDMIYLWCPEKKFALRLTKFVNSSPHYLEVTGNLNAARRTLHSWGI